MNSIPVIRADFPPRSFLLSPEPLLMGTFQAESLASFLARVAEKNDLTLGQLLWGKVMGTHEAANPDIAVLRGIGSVSLAEGSVSTSEAGLKFAEALSRLTGHPSVRLMNWAASTDSLSRARLMRKHQAWCPQCLSEDRIPYFRAAWDLKLVTDCHRHRLQLSQACTHCKAVQRRYRCEGNRTNCQKCERPLSSISATKSRIQDINISRDIGALVAEVTGGTITLSGELMKTALFRWAEQKGATSVKKKARLLGMPQSLVCYWRYTDRQPSLQRLLELCLRNGLPILDVCRGDVEIVESASLKCEIERAWTFRSLSAEEKQVLKDRLGRIAARDYPPCVEHAAKELGIARGTLESLAPEVCKEMGKRSIDQKSLINTVRFLRFRNKVDLCVKAKVKEGKVPTRRHIAMCLSNPGILRSPIWRQYADTAIRQAKVQLFGARSR